MKRPRLAALVSIYRKHAHAQHIVDRFLEGYGWEGRHHRPEMDVVSMYVDQVGDDDASAERETRHDGLTRYPTVAECLTLGGNDLAVDGVLLIAEHGEYETNEIGQTLWPRYEFFQQMEAVFRACRRSVPVFVDKHLSWNWEWARDMFDVSRELEFPLMAGSSLPVTWRLPPVDLPMGAEVREALCLGVCWIDGGDFHAFESVQAFVERRAGGESGIAWVEALRGDDVWQAHADGRWSRDLFEAALSRSHALTPARSGFNNTCPTVDEMRHLVKDPWAYVYQHNDGLQGAVIALNGLIGDFNVATRIEGQDKPLSTNLYLPMPSGNPGTLASFFSPLSHHVERMILTGQEPYPAERTLLTTGLTEAAVQSLHSGKRVRTPHLNVSYQANPKSTYWRS